MFLALTYFIQGFLHESWNYFSGTHPNGQLGVTYNPDYWSYSIPYVDVWHISEMPLLGYMGYMPFGVYCGIWWILYAYLLNIPTNFQEDGF